MNMFQGADYAPFATTNVAVKPRAGRLVRVYVNTAVTGNLVFYDNPSAASGQVLCTVVAPVQGASISLDIPAKTGIYLTPGSAGAGIVVFS